MPPSAGVSRPLPAELSAVLPRELAGFSAGLAPRDDPRPGRHADELLDTAMVAAIVARFDDTFGATDPRAVMSMWASIYFATALPPLLAANILLGVEPDLDLGRIGFIIAPNLKIESVKIGPAAAVPDTSRRFDRLIDTHLAPFIDLVAHRGRISPRLLWSNAGTVFEAFVRKLQSLSDRRHQGFDHGLELLASPGLPNGDANPLFEPVRYVEGRRIRRVCCIRFLIPSRHVCGVCPLPAASPARGAATAIKVG